MPYDIKTASVFGGSSMGNTPIYAEQMQALGNLLAELNIEAYIGGMSGMMEALAYGVLNAGGQVTVLCVPHQTNGALSDVFQSANVNIKQLERDNDRTVALLESDLWISGPGSGGTLGETVRGITWNVDRTYRDQTLTPHFLFNVERCFDDLQAVYQGSVDRGFGADETMQLFQLVNSVDEMHKVIEAVQKNGQKKLHKVSQVTPSIPPSFPASRR